MDENTSRRPVNSRNQSWAKHIAIWLKDKGLKPNQISVMSCVFAFAAGLCLFGTRYAELRIWDFVLFFLAAAMIQGRLLCNLFDGMVAVEGGLKSNSGEIFNDFPDRISDALIMIGAGYAVSFNSWGTTLGWIAAVLAVLTAYVRMLGAASGTAHYFSGPMAKQHRMAVMTFACLLSMFEQKGYIIEFALWCIIVGCLVTVFRRLRKIVRDLESNA